MRNPLTICGLLGLLALAGCSSGNKQASLEEDLFRTAVAGRRAPAPAAPNLTRADLDKITGPLLETTVERRDQTGLLYISAEAQDATPGRVLLWRSGDNATLTLRNGVLVGTHGLGGDIISARVQVSGSGPGPSASGPHVLHIRSRDNRAVRLALACDLVDLGPETIEIVEIRHATRHLQQRCEGAGGSVVNDYWIDHGAGLIWQSRQWAGPHIGYLRLRRLTR